MMPIMIIFIKLFNNKIELINEYKFKYYDNKVSK